MNQLIGLEAQQASPSMTDKMPAMARRFWSWVKDEQSEARTLYLDGVIAKEQSGIRIEDSFVTVNRM